MRVRIVTPVRCARKTVVVDRIHDDVMPFTTCSGIDVGCAGPFVEVTAVCPKGQAEDFRRLVRQTARYPVLAGRKKRRR